MEELMALDKSTAAGGPARGNHRVREVMTRDPQCVTERDTVREAARIMQSADTGVVPVVDDGRRIIGMITDRDIVVRLVAEGKDPMNARVNEAMTKSVRKVDEDAPINEVVELMSSAQIRRVPVVNKNDEIVGIVSLADLATETNQTGKVGKTVENISEGPGNN
jgi:CBS domain-containing protein